MKRLKEGFILHCDSNLRAGKMESGEKLPNEGLKEEIK
jgi:hypothetical protein